MASVENNIELEMKKMASVENYSNLNTKFTELPSPNKLDGHRYRIDCEFVDGVCTICKIRYNCIHEFVDRVCTICEQRQYVVLENGKTMRIL